MGLNVEIVREPALPRLVLIALRLCELLAEFGLMLPQSLDLHVAHVLSFAGHSGEVAVAVDRRA